MVVEDFKTMRFTEPPEHRAHYYGVSVCTVCHGNAGPHDFVVDVGGKEEVRKFADGLDAGGDRFTPKLLALEVVNRSIHDLELNYESKEA